MAKSKAKVKDVVKRIACINIKLDNYQMQQSRIRHFMATVQD